MGIPFEITMAPSNVRLSPEQDAVGTWVFIAEDLDNPGCISHGATPAEALANIADAQNELHALREELGIKGSGTTSPPMQIGRCGGGDTLSSVPQGGMSRPAAS